MGRRAMGKRCLSRALATVFCTRLRVRQQLIHHGRSGQWCRTVKKKMASETVLRPAWQARESVWVCRSKTVISFNYGALSVVILSRLFVFASFLFLISPLFLLSLLVVPILCPPRDSPPSFSSLVLFLFFSEASVDGPHCTPPPGRSGQEKSLGSAESTWSLNPQDT